MKICMAGAAGRMGRRILELSTATDDIGIGGALEAPACAGITFTVGGESGKAIAVTTSADAGAELAKADVLIDFTGPEACLANVQAAVAAGKPVVIGTTGLNAEQKAVLAECAKKVAIVHAPNMSVGVNLLFKLTRQVAEILGLDYNVEITEIHHNQKKDSPSGTAVRLGECAAAGLGLDYQADTVHGREGIVGKRPVREIGMHAIRGGDVVGEHTVSFFGQGERIELTHKAHNRDNFAKGSLVAARFAATAKPGLYDMQDVLGLK
ncbi:MAG: 4-hydroxy-tetrahydrodipicolinate reductase [FCB group bacterium]|jgi:4-hydroxy-tetrahydrodipicolinate reductase|nr:4-hydroxy-tetrahydrodipicolinate reductase [FCB group bacterium]